MSPFRPGSSPVDWCEPNYIVTSSIAEFTNTISNIIFILVPLISIKLFSNYGKYMGNGMLIVLLLLIVVGISSAYFHCSLSLVGQLLDELSILWVIAVGFGLWLPRRLLPLQFHGNRKRFQDFTIAAAALTSLFSWMFPSINAFALMLLFLPASIVLRNELKRCKDARVVNLGYRSCCVLTIAVICWLVDRLCCSWCLKWGVPNLHAFWHIFICSGSYMSCVLFAYFEAHNEAPELNPYLLYWPSNSLNFGIPYIHLETGQKDHNRGQI